ncbi:Glycoside hydrolase [Phytophthora megakarya]|uniref:Glycoside hydrolase n=1 Tax=Phytophthora megakarya TaxID=4795 RepID=A0A225UJC9_9STRA|nr:Glycoside hydrolase [Phytophthora megakarya]
MKLFVAATALAAASCINAQQEFCGRNDLQVVGDYTVYNNLWGEDNDKTGGQCTTVDSHSGSEIAWHTSFNWAGDNWQVKSYANAALKFDPVQISNVTSIPTTMEYTYKYDGNIITNVAYDLFTSPRIGGETAYELMVWLAALGGAWPLTSTGQPIKTVTLGGVDFNLYQGWNNKTKVFTYVAKNMATSFSADLKQFFDELPADNTIETTQYLTHVQAGTEPFQGKNATLTVSKYSAAVHTV